MDAMISNLDRAGLNDSVKHLWFTHINNAAQHRAHITASQEMKSWKSPQLTYRFCGELKSVSVCT